MLEALDGWIVKIVEIIDHGKRSRLGRRVLRQGGADKAGASGDQ